MISAIKPVYAIVYIVWSVRMDNVNNYSETQLVSGVNKSLELIRSTLTRRRCKVSCNVITKWAIIGMLLNGHNLNTVVSVCFYSRKDVVRKFFVWRNFLIFWAHTYVTFINQKRISGSNWSLMLKLVRLRWVPKYTIKKIAIFVLLDESWPGRIFIGLKPWRE